ncbi:exosortase-associated protein EpsI, B-type [Aquabacterium sp.]|uniref:exosortase-associated protein EpsI, B-type n=1 Tax=Aquabacterium sp. TaxID=1872578 RepID=UPI003BAF8B51
MSKKSLLSALIAMVLMMAVSWFGDWAKPKTRMADMMPRAPLSAAFPERIGDWVLDKTSLNVPLPPDVAAQVQALYSEVVDRTYVNAAGQRMMVTVAYGKDQSDGFKVHRPEVCYAAQGFEVGRAVDAQLNLGGWMIPVKHVPTQRGARVEPVTYWMVIGDQPVSTPASHKYQQIKYAFQGLIADGLLVRVSSFAPLTPESYEEQAHFIRQWQALVPVKHSPRFFGKENNV